VRNGPARLAVHGTGPGHRAPLYTTASERNPGQTVLAAVSRCGEVDAESAERWLGSSPRAAKRLEGLRPCLHCVALVGDLPELVATSP
jgi:hypothetical protein